MREEAKIDRKTAGVTGIPLSDGVGGLPAEGFDVSLTLAALTVGVEDVEVDEGGMFPVQVGGGRGK